MKNETHPPFNLESEQALLGGIVVANEAYQAVAEFLLPQHFFIAAHSRMFDVMGNLIRNGRQVTPALLKTYLPEDLRIDGKRSVEDYISFLLDDAAPPVQAVDYGRTIHDLAIRRQLIEIAEAARQAAAGANVDDDPGLQIEELEKKLSDLKANSRIKSSNGLKIVRVDQVEPREVRWVWKGRLAAGHLTLIVGSPGDGKSQISLDATARITTAGIWPDEGRAETGSVVLLSAEDSLGDTIRPRLEAAGADLGRVHVVEATLNQNGREGSFDLQSDLDKLRREVAEIGDVRLVVIDPITSYLGAKIDSHRTTDVRSVLAPLSRFAEEMGIAVLAISHPPKAAQAKAINSATGSLAFVAAARLFFVTSDDPDTKGRKLLLPVKSNLCAPAAGLGYHTEECVVSKGIKTSHIVWDSAPVTITADQAVQNSGVATVGKLADAKDFLRAYLADGAAPALRVKAAATEEGISPATLRRATGRKEGVGIVMTKAGFQGESMWALPDQEGQTVDQDADNVVRFKDAHR